MYICFRGVCNVIRHTYGRRHAKQIPIICFINLNIIRYRLYTYAMQCNAMQTAFMQIRWVVIPYVKSRYIRVDRIASARGR